MAEVPPVDRSAYFSSSAFWRGDAQDLFKEQRGEVCEVCLARFLYTVASALAFCQAAGALYRVCTAHCLKEEPHAVGR